MNGPHAQVISYRSSKGLLLKGLLFLSKQGGPTVLHVHGACGNFLSFTPLLREAAILSTKGINLLTINTSGHDCIAEGFRGENYEYVGGSVSPFGECVADISGAIAVASSFSSKIILQGHSLGCDRIVHYQLMTNDWRDTILISPCDSYRLQQNFLGDETVEAQLERLKHHDPEHTFKLLPPTEYGVHNRGEDYHIPVNLQTFLSIAEGPPYKLFRLDNQADYYLLSRCFAVIGGRDDLQTAPPETMFNHLTKRFAHFEQLLLSKSDHEMEPEADELFQRLADWVK
jgi:hypothetical protein